MKDKIILCGSTGRALAEELSQSLKIPLAFINIRKFPNREIKPIVPVDLLRRKKVFYLSSTYAPAENVLEFLFTIDTLKRIEFKPEVNVLVTWFGYSRQDKVDVRGAPLSARYLISRIPKKFKLTVVDFHNPKAFPSVRNIVPHELFGDFLLKKYRKVMAEAQAVALDKKAWGKTKLLSSYLSLPYPPAQIEKERNPHTGEITTKGMRGELKGKTLILFDDIISGGSILKEIIFLKKRIKAEIILAITHPCFFLVEKANINQVLKEVKILLTTNSIPQSQKISRKIKILSLTSVLAPILRK